jgi:hypothetical protein
MAIFVLSFKLFTIAQLLAQPIFLLVSLVRENLRGLRENLKHKIRALVMFRPREVMNCLVKLAKAADLEMVLYARFELISGPFMSFFTD